MNEDFFIITCRMGMGPPAARCSGIYKHPGCLQRENWSVFMNQTNKQTNNDIIMPIVGIGSETNILF